MVTKNWRGWRHYAANYNMTLATVLSFARSMSFSNFSTFPGPIKQTGFFTFWKMRASSNALSAGYLTSRGRKGNRLCGDTSYQWKPCRRRNMSRSISRKKLTAMVIRGERITGTYAIAAAKAGLGDAYRCANGEICLAPHSHLVPPSRYNTDHQGALNLLR
jgi:hypothetical protein